MKPIADFINRWSRKLPTWPVYGVAILVPAWYLYLGFHGGLGVDPIAELEHRLGRLALQFLIAGLVITPLRNYTGINLIRFRRAIGLTAFYLVGAHLLAWMLFDVGAFSAAAWGRIIADIVKRYYITVGMLGLLMLIPLAVTSNNYSLRKLGPIRWRQIHWLVYPAVVAGGVHFVLERKGWQTQPLTYLAIILGLLAIRVWWNWRKTAMRRRRMATA